MCKKRGQISIPARNLIISDDKDRKTYRKIGKKYKISKSAVYKIYKKYFQHSIIKNLIGQGRIIGELLENTVEIFLRYIEISSYN